VNAGNQILYQRGTGNGTLKVALVNGALQFSYVDGTGTTYTTTSTATSWAAGAWHHFAGQLDASGLTQWVDGSDQQVTAAALGAETVNAGPTTIAASDSGTNFFAGLIDELRVSSVTRYTGANFAVPNAAFANDGSTVALYHFDEASGTTAAASDTWSAQTATLVGSSIFIQPLLSGTSDAINGVSSVVSGAVATAEVLTTSAWSELTAVQTLSPTVNESATMSASTVSPNNIRGATSCDLLFGLSSGAQVRRR
jgi:hypothetical protein